MTSRRSFLPSRPARRRDMKGTVLNEDPDRRLVLARFRPRPGATKDAVEKATWRDTMRLGPQDSASVEVLENGVYRNPRPWTGRTPAGSPFVVKAGDRLVTFRLDASTWRAHKAGALTPLALLRETSEPSRKDSEVAKKKTAAKMLKAQGEVLDAALDRLDRRLEAAKRRYENEPESRSARADLQQIGRQRLMAQLIVRDNQLDAAGKLQRGTPVAVFKNARALPDDTNAVKYQ